MRRVYYINGEEIGWQDFIKFAENFDSEFKESHLKSTSVAATILEKNGYKVDCVETAEVEE